MVNTVRNSVYVCEKLDRPLVGGGSITPTDVELRGTGSSCYPTSSEEVRNRKHSLLINNKR